MAKKDTPSNRWKPGQSGNKATQFKPGQSGNPSGRPKKRLLDEILEELLEEHDSETAKSIGRALIKKALKGDVKAIQLAAERTQGKARQAVEVTGANGSALELTVHVVGGRAETTA